MAKLNGNISAKGKGFDNFPENINKNGRPISIRNQLKELLNSNGETTIPKEGVIKINEDGSIVIKLPTASQIAFKLSEIATTGKNIATLKAIEILIKQTESSITKKVKVISEPKDDDMKLNLLSFSELMLIKVIHIINTPREKRSSADINIIKNIDKLIEDVKIEFKQKI